MFSDLTMTVGSATISGTSLTTGLWEVVSRICGKFPTLGSNFMVVFPDKHGLLTVDRVAVGVLVFFLNHLVLIVCSYCVLFDSDGTENPGWTFVFG
jgi:hypothetical protein